MKIQDFDKKYYFHDSLVDSIVYNSEKHELVIIFDFCYWAQADYKKDKPETGLLKVTFRGVKKYDGIRCSFVYRNFFYIIKRVQIILKSVGFERRHMRPV